MNEKSREASLADAHSKSTRNSLVIRLLASAYVPMIVLGLVSAISTANSCSRANTGCRIPSLEIGLAFAEPGLGVLFYTGVFPEILSLYLLFVGLALFSHRIPKLSPRVALVLPWIPVFGMLIVSSLSVYLYSMAVSETNDVEPRLVAAHLTKAVVSGFWLSTMLLTLLAPSFFSLIKRSIRFVSPTKKS